MSVEGQGATLKIKGGVKRRLLRGVKWAAAAKLTRLMAGVLVNALLARLLSQDDLGVYFLMVTSAAILSIVALFGMDVASVKLLSEALAKAKNEMLRGTIQSIFLFVSIGIFSVGMLLWLCGADLIEKVYRLRGMGDLNLFLIFWMALLTLQTVTAEMYRGLHKINIAVMTNRTLATVANLVFFFSIWLVFDEIKLSTAIIITLVPLALISFFGIGHLLSITRGVYERTRTSYNELWRIGWPQTISSVALYNLSQAAVLLLGAFKNPQSVAIYVTALKLMMFIRLPQFIINSVVPPLIAELNAKGERKRLERILRGASLITIIFSGTIFASYLVFGDSLLAFLYGEKYSVGYSVLAILAAGQLVNVGVGSCGKVLAMTGHQRSLMTLSIITVMLTVGLALLLVEEHGEVGVALAFSLGMVFQSLAALVLSRKKIGIWTHPNLNTRDISAFLVYVKSRGKKLPLN